MTSCVHTSISSSPCCNIIIHNVGVSCCNLTFFEFHSTQCVCFHGLCVWMVGKLEIPGCSHEHVKASIDCCLCASCLSSIFNVFFVNSIMLAMPLNLLIRTFTPHYNHLDYLHPTMGAHLLCLESITHHSFQFGPKGFECLLPSMVQASPSFLTYSLRIWPTMNFFPTSSPPSWSNAPCLFVDKGHQTITTSLWSHLKFCIQTISKNP